MMKFYTTHLFTDITESPSELLSGLSAPLTHLHSIFKYKDEDINTSGSENLTIKAIYMKK